MKFKESLFSYKNSEPLLLAIRAVLGISFIVHGYPKIIGGVPMWEKLGGAMGELGIHFFPVFWGFMASFAEFGGGILLLLGLFTRPAAALIAFTMLVASIKHISQADGFNKFSHPIELMVMSLYYAFSGGGRRSLDQLILNIRKK